MKKQVIAAATSVVATSAALLANVSIQDGENSIEEPTQKTEETGPVAAPKTNVKIEQIGAPATTSGPSNLFISVKTFDVEGKTVGERIVDMYHFGTRNWLQNHHWWAMHNSHCVETNVATQDEVTGYLAASKVALAAKFNAPKAVAA